MALTRVTEGMVGRLSLAASQDGLVKLARLQERLTTGRVLNRPSDSPVDTTTSLRLRDAVAMNQQHQRNAQDAQGWMGTVDAALASVTEQTRQARDVALQGGSSAAMGQAARDALASTVDGLRSSLLATANTTLLGRPVFGGTTAGEAAYAQDGSYVGDGGAVLRTVGPQEQVRVDVDGASVFGAAGNTVFDHLTALSTALRAGDEAGVRTGIGALNRDLEQVTTSRAEMGTRQARVEAAVSATAARELDLRSSLSSVEDADLPETIIDLKLQEAAYQAALGATARVLQPSLMDYLR
ncbi:flagellar hook-associated protein 3 FlgL [Nocardioides scoriae]|uniref:Flagellin n=1 Tax=Nocardioides scoriae TaxID=642780 RepID=A0A1H1S4A1_9ACTN|nr:flagellin [Nocardioides scoriae]SDS42920.1 flagellar hook-associated protein 3 FlgL [Nocardioides scoriae]